MLQLLNQLEVVRRSVVSSGDFLEYLPSLIVAIFGCQESRTLQEIFVREWDCDDENTREEHVSIFPSGDQAEDRQEEGCASPNHGQHVDRNRAEPWR